MRVRTLVLCCLSILLFTGCTYSVHPILLESDQTTDIDLSGTWAMPAKSQERRGRLEFSIQSADGGANYVGVIDGGKPFAARIGKLADAHYLQLSPHEPTRKEPGLLSSIPVHLIARFEVVNDELRIFPIGHDNAIPWFDEHKVSHRLIDTVVKHCVLTDDTPTLQKLFKDHGDKLFSKTGLTFTRKHVAVNQSHESRESELHGGKSLDQWIAQAKQAHDLEDRHDAVQVVRNFGLRIDRARTLRVFTELLSDDAPTIRSLAAAGIRTAGRPTDPKALDKLAELLSRDLTGLIAPHRPDDVGDQFVLPMREVSVLGTLGNTSHIPVLQRLVDNEDIDPFLCQMAKKAIQEIKTRNAASDKEQIRAIEKLEFLVGIWKSVDSDDSPAAREIRTITMQPNGRSLTMSTDSVLGKGQPFHIAYNVEAQEYLLTRTDPNGQERVWRAKLTDGNRLEIPIERKDVLLAGMIGCVTVTDDLWTESFQRSEKPDDTWFERRFVRQPEDHE